MNDATKTTSPRDFRPGLSYFKPSPKGTGCAIRFELHPAHKEASDGIVLETEGSLMVEMSNQLTVGDRRGPVPTYPHFDWENKICLRLGFSDLCQILQVFRGECETLGDGKGIYHRTAGGTAKIMLRHQIDPTPGYFFEVYKNSEGNPDGDRHAGIFLSSAEALGLMVAIEDSMGVIAFGIPKVILRNTADYRRKNREAVNARVA